MLAVRLTGAGYAVIPFVLVTIAAIVALIVVVRRRRHGKPAGFDIDEASNYVWANFTPAIKGRLAMSQVVAIIEAETDVPDDIAPDALCDVLLAAAHEAGATEAGPDDIDIVLQLQERYAERKGLL